MMIGTPTLLAWLSAGAPTSSRSSTRARGSCGRPRRARPRRPWRGARPARGRGPRRARAPARRHRNAGRRRRAAGGGGPGSRAGRAGPHRDLRARRARRDPPRDRHPAPRRRFGLGAAADAGLAAGRAAGGAARGTGRRCHVPALAGRGHRRRSSTWRSPSRRSTSPRLEGPAVANALSLAVVTAPLVWWTRAPLASAVAIYAAAGGPLPAAHPADLRGHADRAAPAAAALLGGRAPAAPARALSGSSSAWPASLVFEPRSLSHRDPARPWAGGRARARPRAARRRAARSQRGLEPAGGRTRRGRAARSGCASRASCTTPSPTA